MPLLHKLVQGFSQKSGDADLQYPAVGAPDGRLGVGSPSEPHLRPRPLIRDRELEFEPVRRPGRPKGIANASGTEILRHYLIEAPLLPRPLAPRQSPVRERWRKRSTFGYASHAVTIEWVIAITPTVGYKMFGILANESGLVRNLTQIMHQSRVLIRLDWKLRSEQKQMSPIVQHNRQWTTAFMG